MSNNKHLLHPNQKLSAKDCPQCTFEFDMKYDAYIEALIDSEMAAGSHSHMTGERI